MYRIKHKYSIYIAVALFLFSYERLAAQENKDDVISIIESLKTSSEMPFIERDQCFETCPDTGKNKNRRKGCSVYKDIPALIETAVEKGGVYKLLSGRKFILERRSKSKENFIRSKDSKAGIYRIEEGKENIELLKKLKKTNPEIRFVKKYRHLKTVFEDIQFRELCEYIAKNNSRYLSLKRKLVKAGGKKAEK
jgi:hypothetical protein